VDLDWCPQPVRDAVTDWVRFMYNTHKAFNLMAPKLRATLDRAGTHQIVDLCAGGGGPWLTLAPELAKTGPLDVLLTDLHPNEFTFKHTQEQTHGMVRFHAGPVDATNVPPEWPGVRTIWNAFHHFRPDLARSILADAVRTRRPIGVFEGTDNRLLGTAVMFTLPPMMYLLMPFVTPFRWSRLLLTYALPVLPALALWDGTVSMLRTYSPAELREMVASIPDHDSFDWDIGTQPIPRSPIGITYLIGSPRESAGASR
jgi:hypothetical protein